MCARVKALVAQLCPTLCNPMDCSLPGSSVPGILQASHSLLQGIFPTQGSKLGLLHCRQILYCLSHQGSPILFHTVALYPKWEPCQNFLIKWAKDSLVKVKVTQLCPTLCNPIDCSPWNSPGQNTGVGSCSLLQRIFPTQGLNPGLPYYKWILYQLSHNGSQKIHYLTHTINSLFCMMYKYSLILWCAIHACHTLWGKKITTIMVFKKIILWKQLFQNMWHGSYPGRWSRKRGLPGCAYWSSWAPCIFLSEMLTEHQPSKAS